MSLNIKTGTYDGNGTSQSITGLGFQPKMCWIRSGASNRGPFRIDTMAAGVSVILASSPAINTDAITSLDSDGFTLGSNTDANGSGTTYYYLAVGGDDCTTGTYTGDGVDDRDITGTTFTPKLVITACYDSALAPIFRLDTHASGSSNTFSATGVFTNEIKSFNANGFRLGTGTNANTLNNAYAWIAIKDTARFKTGSYTGNFTDNRNITGVGINPTNVIIKSVTGSVNAVWKPSSLGGPPDSTIQLGNLPFTIVDSIQSLITDGFQIGRNATVNSNAVAYVYFAFLDGSDLRVKIGTYTGDGTVGRAVTGVGFQPRLVMIQGEPAHQGALHTDVFVVDSSKFFSGSAIVGASSHTVKGFDADGFTVNYAEASLTYAINQSGVKYYYLALTGTDLVTNTYTGDGTDNRWITGVGATPMWVTTHRRESSSWGAIVFRTDSYVGDLSSFYNDGATLANMIQDFNTDGFQLGTIDRVNKASTLYEWFAVKTSSPNIKTGTYTGDGTDNRNITGIGFNPTAIIIKNGTSSGAGTEAIWKTVYMEGDNASIMWYNGATWSTNCIKSFITDGFQIGTDNKVNKSGSTYYYIALYDESYTPPTPPSTGNMMPLSHLMIGERL